MQDAIRTHYSSVRRVLIVVLVFNWAVALVKIVYGLFSQCASMTADGFHSLSDGASNIIGLIGIGLSAHPRDEGHPYGHKKFETLFSLGIAALLFIIAVNLAREGIVRFRHPVVPQVDFASFAVMVITLAINVGVVRYEYRRGKRFGSDILVADAMHTRADILTTCSVIVALCAIKFGYPILDPIVAVIISIFIAYAGFDIIKHGSGVLCDEVVIKDTKKIEDVVLAIQGVKSCHKIRTRGREDDVFVDLHCRLDPSTPLQEAHKISHAIETALKAKFPEVTEVMVHPEPG